MGKGERQVLTWFFVVMAILMFYAATQTHPQWFLWIPWDRINQFLNNPLGRLIPTINLQA